MVKVILVWNQNRGDKHLSKMSGMDGATGWCIFNDLAVAARAAQRDAAVEKVFFVDLDVHQGEMSYIVLHVNMQSKDMLYKTTWCSDCSLAL